MPQSVCIRTGARLHFGLLTQHPHEGREFGGLGVMIAKPGWQIAVERAETNQIEVEPSVSIVNSTAEQRTAEFLARISGSANSDAWSVRVIEAIEGHQGLGSGTQLGLAIAKAIALLTNSDAPVDQLARQVGRGRRSAIGIWGFDAGGFIVDGGKLYESSIGSLVARFEMPANWCFVLATPTTELGLSGSEEIAAFAALPSMPRATTTRLCQLSLMTILPALRDQDFSEFAAGLFEYGQLVGEYFSPVQGGVFSSPMMADAANALRASRLPRPVQTSWGPTCAIPCSNTTTANEVMDCLESRWPRTSLLLRIVQPLNTGAETVCR